jgi:hypothetical protein
MARVKFSGAPGSAGDAVSHLIPLINSFWIKLLVSLVTKSPGWPGKLSDSTLGIIATRADQGADGTEMKETAHPTRRHHRPCQGRAPEISPGFKLWLGSL